MCSFYNFLRGYIISLWPKGYKQHETKCCPSMELHQYVHDNALEEVTASLPIQHRFRKEAELTKLEIASEVKTPIEDITFIGLHNR